MTRLRVITHALILDGESVLLARNKDANFWYPPGGGWEFESESIKDSVSREVTEETGYKVDVGRLLWVREFREPEKDKVSLETFWTTEVSAHNTQTVAGLSVHIDHDQNGAVEQCKWFTFDELQEVKVLPGFIKERLQNKALDGDSFVDA